MSTQSHFNAIKHMYSAIHETPDNVSAMTLLHRDYFPLFVFSSHIPISWAKDVLLLLKEVDALGGLRAPNDSRYVRTMSVPEYFKHYWNSYRALTAWYFLKFFVFSMRRDFDCFFTNIVGHIKNAIFKRKVNCIQIKEKMGTLRFYYLCKDKELYAPINKLIRKTELILAKRGVFGSSFEELLQIEAYKDTAVEYGLI